MKEEERRLREQQAENFFKQLEGPFNQPFGFDFPRTSIFETNGRSLQDTIGKTSPVVVSLPRGRFNGTLHFLRR